MKRLVSATLLATALAAPLAARAQSTDNDLCSNASLYGDYAFRVSGQIVYPGRPPGAQVETRNGVAMTHFDGYGHLSQVDFVMANGKPLPGATDPVTGFHINETGTYTVYADCTGRAEIDLQTPIGPAKISLMLVLGNGGRTLHTVVSHLAPPDGSLALPYIQSDAEKLGVVTTNVWYPNDPH